MTSRIIKLLSREIIASGTMAFHFEKPPDFSFKAGQYIQMSLIDPPETDDDGNTRTLSIASSPYENELMFAMRIRDKAFKRVLKTMPLGSTVKIDGPFGSLVLTEDKIRPIVFLVGGIGITPVLSILRQALYEKRPQPFYLFYANHKPEDIAFKDILCDLDKNFDNFRLITTVTSPEINFPGWTGEKGHLSAKMISAYAPDYQDAFFYVVGSLDMVMSMTTMARQMGIADGFIKYEEFIGY